MIWLVPAALFGLVAITGPLALHLLRRRTARRLVVPTTRFVASRTNAAVRIRRVSDPLLLLVRVAILASAALALAGPLWLGAIVIDTTASAKGRIPTTAVEAERSSANHARIIESTNLGGAMQRAAAWLATAPPARREIVVLSDFQRGAMTQADVARVPAAVGLRFVPSIAGAGAVAGSPRVRTLVPAGIVAGDVTFDGEATSVKYSAPAPGTGGLRILAPPGDAEGTAALLRVVARAGAAAPDPAQPIVVRLRGADAIPLDTISGTAWTVGAARRMLRSLQAAETPIHVASTGEALVVAVDAEPSSLIAAEALKAALDARQDPRVLHEHEPARISPQVLAAWTRDPAPPDPATWRLTDDTDGRWFWGLALVLLGVETLVRRAPRETPDAAEAHAA
jgi:hypothetical protein